MAGLVGVAEAGKRWNDDIKRIGRIMTVCRGICEERQNLEHLQK